MSSGTLRSAISLDVVAKLDVLLSRLQKFLIDREGHVVGRWATTTKPEALESEIEKVL